MNIILLGPPGSGKGTQGSLLADKYGLYYFEAGDFVRDLAKSNSRIAEIFNKGELVPEKEMTGYVTEFLEKKSIPGKNILFDGYPRFIGQFSDLQDWLLSKGSRIDKAIFLDVADETVIQRLASRRICSNCSASYNLLTNPPQKEGTCDKCGGSLVTRSDDQPEAIRQRLAQYRQNVKPLIEHLDKMGILIKVDGQKPIAEISKDILKELSREGF